jgi:hypothetical protein
MMVVAPTLQQCLGNLPCRQHVQHRCTRRLVCRAGSTPAVEEQTVNRILSRRHTCSDVCSHQVNIRLQPYVSST